MSRTSSRSTSPKKPLSDPTYRETHLPVAVTNGVRTIRPAVRRIIDGSKNHSTISRATPQNILGETSSATGRLFKVETDVSTTMQIRSGPFGPGAFSVLHSQSAATILNKPLQQLADYDPTLKNSSISSLNLAETTSDVTSCLSTVNELSLGDNNDDRHDHDEHIFDGISTDQDNNKETQNLSIPIEEEEDLISFD